jgi:hypothetical protein
MSNPSKLIRNATIYNLLLYGIAVFGMTLVMLVIKYHRLVYGGGVIEFISDPFDIFLICVLGGLGFYFTLKLIEYCYEHNDDFYDRMDTMEIELMKLRLEVIALRAEMKALKET